VIEFLSAAEDFLRNDHLLATDDRRLTTDDRSIAQHPRPVG
jgi:hypothetical protein